MTTTAVPAAPARPARHVLRGQAARFLLVGGLTTGAYLALYLLLRPGLGEQVANLVALALTVDANTLANRRFSFGVQADGGRRREHAQAWVAFAFCLALTSGALTALEALGVESGPVHLGVLVAAEAVAGVVHFALLRTWVFPAHRRPLTLPAEPGLSRRCTPLRRPRLEGARRGQRPFPSSI